MGTSGLSTDADASTEVYEEGNGKGASVLTPKIIDLTPLLWKILKDLIAEYVRTYTMLSPEFCLEVVRRHSDTVNPSQTLKELAQRDALLADSGRSSKKMRIPRVNVIYAVKGDQVWPEKGDSKSSSDGSGTGSKNSDKDTAAPIDSVFVFPEDANPVCLGKNEAALYEVLLAFGRTVGFEAQKNSTYVDLPEVGKGKRWLLTMLSKPEKGILAYVSGLASSKTNPLVRATVRRPYHLRGSDVVVVPPECKSGAKESTVTKALALSDNEAVAYRALVLATQNGNAMTFTEMKVVVGDVLDVSSPDSIVKSLLRKEALGDFSGTKGSKSDPLKRRALVLPYITNSDGEHHDTEAWLNAEDEAREAAAKVKEEKVPVEEPSSHRLMSKAELKAELDALLKKKSDHEANVVRAEELKSVVRAKSAEVERLDSLAAIARCELEEANAEVAALDACGELDPDVEVVIDLLQKAVDNYDAFVRLLSS